MENSRVRSILSKQCGRHTVATIIASDSGVACRGRFTALMESTVALDGLAPPEAALFRTLSVAAVCFHSQSRGSTFLSSVIEFKREKSWLGKLVFRLPSEIFSTETRVAVRVSLPSNTQLAPRVTSGDGRVWESHPLDISLSGILIEFPVENVPEWQIDEPLDVELRRSQYLVKLAGVVRRRDGRRYGLLFPEVIRGVEFDPPMALRRIVQVLETDRVQGREPLRSSVKRSQLTGPGC